ncbi:MAG TPA: sulfatase-like hydrolase/transferase, partial [Polyangiaceae bacterium]|nr:sulfatase-like hydrolase/transferase [Polyangiaceae bacterium]
MRLNEDELRVIALPTFKEPLEAGRHRITLRFARPPRNNRAPLAELDWIRIGGKDDPPGSYAAPTLTDIVSDVVLTQTPRRSFVLRASSTLHCFLRPSPDAKLKLWLGFWGAGSGVAAVTVVRDSGPPMTLQTRRLTGGDAAIWTPLELDLGEYSSEIIGLELTALEATRGGRVAFGDPVIVRSSAAVPEPPLARTAIMIVLGAVDRSLLPPWAATGQMTALGELARTAVAFSQYRAPTTLVPGVLATLLTGLPPRAHQLEQVSDRLAPGLRTLQRIVKEASGRTAMFSSVPTSFAPFGFDAGWDVFESFSPVSDQAAGEPFFRAARWLESELDNDAAGRRLVLIHARGGHPPWDISREEAQALKPPDYTGALDPRRGGIVLGGLRARNRRNVRRLTDDDWVRLRALVEASLVKQDQGIARLITVLKAKNAWDSALVIVVGDVAPPSAPELPYDPAGTLNEDRLAVPLLVKFPGGLLAGKEVNVGSCASDLPVTVLSALGLRAPNGMAGMDLFDRAQGRTELTGDAQVATLPGRYAT